MSNNKELKNNLQKYAKEEGISYDYILNQAQAIVEELNKSDYVSKAYLLEKMENIKNFMSSFQ